MVGLILLSGPIKVFAEDSDKSVTAKIDVSTDLAAEVKVKAEALAEMDSLKNILESTNDEIVKLNVLTKLAIKVHDTDPQQSIELFKKALFLSKKHKKPDKTLLLLHNLGKIYKDIDNYQLAINYYSAGLILAKAQKSLEYESRFATNMGGVYLYQGDYNNALKYMLNGLKIDEELGNKEDIGISYISLGAVYRTLENHDEALQYLFKARDIFVEAQSSYYSQYCYRHIGIVYSELGNSDSALKYYEISHELAQEINSKGNIAISLNNLGTEYQAIGNYQKALEYFNRSLALKTELEDKMGIAVTLGNLANVYFEYKKYDRAFTYYDKGLKIASEIGAEGLQMEFYETIAEKSADLSDYQKAYEYHQIFSQIKDSLLNTEKTKQIAEMQTKYETEKKEKEIELLNKDNELKATQLAQKEEEAQKQRVIMISVILTLVLSIAFALVLFNRFRLIRTQKNIIEEQKGVVDQKNKDITDSINYANRIQNAILVPETEIAGAFPESFLLYKPKDIVSGDFYFFSKFNENVILSVIDCTGHGVPGAFMSMVGNDALNHIVNEEKIIDPGKILAMLHDRVKTALRQEKIGTESQDGMDIAMCCINSKTLNAQFAGAYNPLYVLKNGNDEIEVMKADKIGIGGIVRGIERTFHTHNIKLSRGDCMYMFSDGYVDQFGGPKNKRFMSKRFKELIYEIRSLTMKEQKEKLDTAITEWKGSFEQTDDITVIGVKI
ncbi:MAG: tetratricopeptide repeat protein [Bacteroidia bacterium]|nr:tetratricopeptide repeat protein [Bacteroidia bacterium]